MNRYLINLSYIGTRFRGIQRKIDKTVGQFKDPHTVQGVIEEALLKLRPVNEPLLKLSSRHPRFDIVTFATVAKMFEGMHDFRTFMAVAKGNPRQQEAMHSLRRIDQITVERGQNMTAVFNREQTEQFYDFWDVRIRGRSFLYRQVRRMVGAWVAAAEGRIDERDIYRMLTVPSQNSWCSNVFVAPAYALYLCHVEYDPNDLNFPSAEHESDHEQLSGTIAQS
ncbi:tRNA pseudouridine synthase-like 1 isoform X2 [Anopheles moucheti]|uniref:tRNA pseudouridine synthase-like 1 isoform X2 n=1 Tax=Anopheles moucheti TaxID=186751 RepID=UPI0022F0B3BB|nr:tRNA pseudouridine synthase-like 1 isoform X2 [Anopheles moucheti]